MIPASAECTERAAKAEEASEIACDDGTRESLQRIAASWRRLAETYQFVEGIEAKHIDVKHVEAKHLADQE